VIVDLKRYRDHANDTAINTKASKAESNAAKVDAFAGMSSKKRGLYPCLHNDSKETQLCDEESSEGKVNEWV
tara:strand:- start:35 stop:250 length:216 start_codon:yes stop_codon:yes gene_type:complete